MPRLVVVGGGIAGLAAAWAARRHGGPGVEILVLEREARVGGKARSLVEDGWLVEAGPGAFLGGRPALDQLIAEAGLAGEVLAADKAAAHRFVLSRGRIREIAANPVSLARSGILSAPGFLRLFAEPFIGRRADSAPEETVWQFAARRLGPEFADRLMRPMTLGIFAGDAARLSLPAAFPRMAALEREHGSLIRGAFARRRGPGPGGLFSFRTGLETLPRTLAARGDFRVRCDAAVTRIERSERGWLVAIAGESDPLAADAVVLTGEPWASAALLRPVAPRAAEALEAIPCPPVTVVGLGYSAAASRRVPVGFGVLIGRGEGYRMLGNLWESHLFPARSPDGQLLIRVMLGGAVDPDAGRLSEEEAAALVEAEIGRLYGMDEAPVFRRVVKWPRAIPQYELGHPGRVRTIEAEVATLPGLQIGGSGLHGVAFGDAAASGAKGGEAAAAWLRAPRS